MMKAMDEITPAIPMILKYMSWFLSFLRLSSSVPPGALEMDFKKFSKAFDLSARWMATANIEAAPTTINRRAKSIFAN